MSTLVPQFALLSLISFFFFYSWTYSGPRGLSWSFSSRKKYPYRRGEQEKTSGYLGLESHYHADHNCQTQQIDQWHVSRTCLPASIITIISFFNFFFSGKVNSGKLFDCITNLFPHGWWKGNTITTSHTWSGSKTWCVQFDDYNIAESFNDSSLEQSNYIP